MPFRETLLNLAITAVLVLIVVLAGILLKESRPKRPAATPARAAGATSSLGETKKVLPQFEIFPRAQLIESRANEADTLRIRLRGEEHIFVLYFVDALEASMNHPQWVADQSRYFGYAGDKMIVETGAEAVAYVTNLLKTKPFFVLTRWENVANTARYLALIQVETSPRKYEYLSDLLIKNGYARVADVTTELPSGSKDISTYLQELRRLAEQARTQKLGIWAKVAR